jgi:hypothetical protein
MHTIVCTARRIPKHTNMFALAGATHEPALFIDNPAAVINDAPVVRSPLPKRMLKFFSFAAK